MNCAEIHEKIVLAAYNELADDQAHALSLHLAGCCPCRDEQDQLLALKTLSAANPMLEPSPNLVARSRARLEEALDALPPKRWYDRLADWMTRTAAGLQAAPVAACLLLVAGAGLGSLGGFEFAQRHPVGGAVESERPVASAQNSPVSSQTNPTAATPAPGEIANVSGIVRKPDSNLVEVSYNQIEPQRVEGTLADPRIRQLLMVASQNGASPTVRDDSVSLLAAECRSGNGCEGSAAPSADIRNALMVSLRYDRSATVRRKALSGLEPFVGEDRLVRNAVLEALLNDPDAQVRSAAIGMLRPVEADTSVRQVLSTVALSDQNPHIRDASRVVLRRVSEIQ